MTGDPAVHIESHSQGSKREQPSLETCVAQGKAAALGWVLLLSRGSSALGMLSFLRGGRRELVWCRLYLAATQLAWPP